MQRYDFFIKYATFWAIIFLSYLQAYQRVTQGYTVP